MSKKNIIQFPVSPRRDGTGGLGVNPNFGELMADLRLLWLRWKHTSGTDQENALDNHGAFEAALDGARASTRRMDMEDIERLIEKYGGTIE